MGSKKIGLFPKDYCFQEYKAVLLMEKSLVREFYRVKSVTGNLYYLNIMTIPQTSITEIGINELQTIEHPNILPIIQNGTAIHKGEELVYVISPFFPSETLAQRIKREPISSYYDIKQIVLGILHGLKYLHSLPKPIILNEIIPEHILLDLSREEEFALISDLSHAQIAGSEFELNLQSLNINYLPLEAIHGEFSVQSDIYAVGVIMYQLIFGAIPWFKNRDNYADETDYIDSLLVERYKPLRFPNLDYQVLGLDENVYNVLKKALSNDVGRRFQSCEEFILMLNKEYLSQIIGGQSSVNRGVRKSKHGSGFNAIAGMEDLKLQLKNDIIDLIENPEEYKKHDLGLPNGMLLYGPPGCGKTFFAEKFAEEAGYNFIKVVSSDIASIYIHGSQEKIGHLFQTAREQAPTILYFDELDAMVPNREMITNQSQSGEVNEFLSQLDNIGDSGVFVIGSTNKPDSLDKAVLRSGRLEKWFYIPPPDFFTRKRIFQLYLKNRPLDIIIDYEKLAELTTNYVSSDIKLLVDEASRKTIRDKNKRISMETLEFVIHNQRPTVPLSELEKYEEMRKKIENKNGELDRAKIGFRK